MDMKKIKAFFNWCCINDYLDIIYTTICVKIAYVNYSKRSLIKMKRKFSSAVVSLIIISALCFLAFAEPGFAYSENDLIEFTPKWESIIADDSVISVTPGAEQGELRFAWLSAEGESTPLFIISANADMSSSRECEVIVNKAIEKFNSNNVTVTGLEAGKTYYFAILYLTSSNILSR